jgi:hypothetical protein
MQTVKFSCTHMATIASTNHKRTNVYMHISTKCLTCVCSYQCMASCIHRTYQEMHSDGFVMLKNTHVLSYTPTCVLTQPCIHSHKLLADSSLWHGAQFVVFISLTLFVFFSKADFSWMGLFLFAGSIIMLVSTNVCTHVHANTPHPGKQHLLCFQSTFFSVWIWSMYADLQTWIYAYVLTSPSRKALLSCNISGWRTLALKTVMKPAMPGWLPACMYVYMYVCMCILYTW